jgi:L-amino acid N-acyltransferase YncA
MGEPSCQGSTCRGASALFPLLGLPHIRVRPRYELRTLPSVGHESAMNCPDGIPAMPSLDEFVAARLPWTSKAVAGWYSQPQLCAQIATALGQEVARVGDADFATSFREVVGLDLDVDLLDWANRIVVLDDRAGWALTGIRYRGLDISKPFVDVVACTPAPTNADIMSVAWSVVAAYAGFGPLCARFEIPDVEAFMAQVVPYPGFGPYTGIDMCLVAGLLPRLRAVARVATYNRVELRHGDPAALAERTAGVYADLATNVPVTTLWATPENIESLTDCADQGLLFDVIIDGQPAGVAAALRDDSHAMTGFVVQEIALDSDHRGHNFGPAVLQRMVDVLPGADTDVLWGTIHPDNAASIRNARRVGREYVGAYAWVTPPGLPGMPH